MYVTPVNFRASSPSILSIKNAKPVDAIEAIKSKEPSDIQDKNLENIIDNNTAFKGAEALANYNKAFLMSNPIKDSKIEKDPVEQQKQATAFKAEPEDEAKPIVVDTPAFKAEEGIENLEAQKEKAKL